LTKNAKRQLGALLAKDAFHSIRKRLDPDVYGGAPMLGFNQLVFKAHASAREKAVASAIRVTATTVKNNINQVIAREIAAANLKLEAFKNSSCSDAKE
jgi:glycerol-3-phosphate acyltransferase PlsX